MIKPIDWTYDRLRQVWHGNVHIPDTPGYIVRRASWSLKGHEGTRFLCDDDESAKAAAQADYEARIRLAFIPSPLASTDTMLGE